MLLIGKLQLLDRDSCEICSDMTSLINPGQASQLAGVPRRRFGFVLKDVRLH